MSTTRLRTTVYPESLIDYNFEDLVSQLKLAGVRTFALQEARTEGTPVAFQLMAASWGQEAMGEAPTGARRMCAGRWLRPLYPQACISDGRHSRTA